MCVVLGTGAKLRLVVVVVAWGRRSGRAEGELSWWSPGGVYSCGPARGNQSWRRMVRGVAEVVLPRWCVGVVRGGASQRCERVALVAWCHGQVWRADGAGSGLWPVLL